MLKIPMLEAFQRVNFSHDQAQGLIAQLLVALKWKNSAEADSYSIEGMEIRRVLGQAPADIRRTTAWLLTKWLSAPQKDDDTADKRWREHYGAIFKSIWPLEAKLRDPETSLQLIWMAEACDTCFPDAVDAVVGFIVPMHIHQISITFQPKENSALFAKYPLQMLKLLDVTIDPSAYPVPHDLGSILSDLARKEPDIVEVEAYRRLSGVWKLRQA